MQKRESHMRRRDFAGALALSGAMAGTARATPAETRRIAEQFAATLSARDITAFGALFADDYQQHQNSAAAPPPPAGLSAKQATVAYFTARLTALPDLVVTADPIVAADESVAANFTYAGTHRGTYFGQPPTGRRIVFTSCDILTVRGGLIAAHWGAADIAGLLQQLRG
jgi:predicted ester cyclase